MLKIAPGVSSSWPLAPIDLAEIPRGTVKPSDVGSRGDARAGFCVSWTDQGHDGKFPDKKCLVLRVPIGMSSHYYDLC